MKRSSVLCADDTPNTHFVSDVFRSFTSTFQTLIKLRLLQQPVHPTTGILAVFVALNYCDVVHIAGFGYPSSTSQRHPIHYYGYDTMKSMKVGICVL